MNCFIRGYNAKQAEKDGKPLTVIDRVILLRSKLTHSEFQFSERFGNVSFSFTSADKANGARFKVIGYSHPARWNTREIALTDLQEDLIFAEACTMADCHLADVAEALKLGGQWGDVIIQGSKHKLYDFAGLLSHALKRSGKWWLNIIRFGLWSWTIFVKPHPDKCWCSEACAHLVKMAYPDFDGSPDSLDPQELDDELVKFFKVNV